MVATTVYETKNYGGDNITPGEDVKGGQTLTSGWGCRCEENTNVPGAPHILDPPLARQPSGKQDGSVAKIKLAMCSFRLKNINI